MQIIPRKNPYQFIGRIMAGTGGIAGLFAAMNADGSGGVWTVAVLGLVALSLLVSGMVLILAAREIEEIQSVNFELNSSLRDANKEIGILRKYANPECDSCSCSVSGLDYGPEFIFGEMK